jgi:beta-catenin-like protein 1
MTTVDELFKKPSVPSKRKLEVSHNPADFYKPEKKVALERPDDEKEEEEEAGPELPPDEEDDYGPEDDEDGRFFGGGVAKGTKAAMAFVDTRDEAEPYVEENYDVSWIRKIGVNFEKKISRNSDMRAKYENDHSRFIASEADLDSAIKELSVLAEHPELYSEFVKLGCMASLVSLLAHENVDIAIDAIQIISELMDEDTEAPQKQWEELAEAAVDADLLPLLQQNLDRFDESQQEDRDGVYNALLLLESLLSNQRFAAIIAKDKALIKWLLNRASKSEKDVTSNKQYSAEILAILVHEESTNRLALIDLDAVDILLQLLAPYRRQNPVKTSEEEEWFENLFDALCCLVKEPQGKAKFCEAEGVELCLILMREAKIAKPRALKLLSFAAEGGAEVCLRIVEAQGLKTVFGMFMKKLDSEGTANILTILSALLNSLPDGSPERIRALAKFVEKDYEKIAQLLKLRRNLAPKIQIILDTIQRERKLLSPQEIASHEAEWTTQTVEAGLYNLRYIDLILAWLCVEDKGAKDRTSELLTEQDGSLADISTTLKNQLAEFDETDTDSAEFKSMLDGLLAILDHHNKA